MSHRNKFHTIIPVLLSVFFLSACESWLPDAHRPDFTQGNAIKREALDKIRVGMTKADIIPVLGSPMLIDPFHVNRWDYMYRYLPGRGEIIQSRLTLFFENDILIRIDDSEYREHDPDREKKEFDPTPVEALPGPLPDPTQD